MCRCTGSQSWRRGDGRNDWVWVTQRPGRCHGVLNGPLPWQLQRLFKIKFLNDDEAFVEYWLALVLTTIPENSGNLDPVSNFGQVRNAPAGAASSAKNISVRAERLRQSGRAPSEPSETPRWRIAPHPVSIPRVALHIALQSLFHRFFSLCRSPILNKHSGVGANCDHTS